MSVLCACVNFQLTEHGTASGPFWQHAFDGSFDYHFRFTLNQLVEADGLDTTRETGGAWYILSVNFLPVACTFSAFTTMML